MEAARLIGRRFVQLAVVLLLVTFFTFSLVRLLPGDPAQTIIPFGTDQQRAQLSQGPRRSTSRSSSSTSTTSGVPVLKSDGHQGPAPGRARAASTPPTSR